MLLVTFANNSRLQATLMLRYEPVAHLVTQDASKALDFHQRIFLVRSFARRLLRSDICVFDLASKNSARLSSLTRHSGALLGLGLTLTALS